MDVDVDVGVEVEVEVEVEVVVERALLRAVRMGLKGDDDRCRG